MTVHGSGRCGTPPAERYPVVFEKLLEECFSAANPVCIEAAKVERRCGDRCTYFPFTPLAALPGGRRQIHVSGPGGASHRHPPRAPSFLVRAFAEPLIGVSCFRARRLSLRAHSDLEVELSPEMVNSLLKCLLVLLRGHEDIAGATFSRLFLSDEGHEFPCFLVCVPQVSHPFASTRLFAADDSKGVIELLFLVGGFGFLFGAPSSIG